MNNIFYFIIYQFSRLPLSVLYVFSDILFFLLHTVIGYRRKVIVTNLKNSFPEKSDNEINKIYKDFYRNFSDFLVETLKSMSISQEEYDKRISYTNVEAFQEIKAEGKDCLLMTGHMFNWEFLSGTAEHMQYEHDIAVYHKIKNPFWNDKINLTRERFGTEAIDMKDIMRYMMRTPNDGTHAYLFIADQSPKKQAIHYWLNFLNQETPVFNAFDKIATRKDLGVIFCYMQKVRRGYYHVSYERITPKNGIKFEENEIVHTFFHKLENAIKAQPANWLWSHKRWKYKKEDFS